MAMKNIKKKLYLLPIQNFIGHKKTLNCLICLCSCSYRCSSFQSCPWEPGRGLYINTNVQEIFDVAVVSQLLFWSGMRIEDPTFFPWIRLSREKNPDPTLNRNEEKNIYLYFSQVSIKVDLINHRLKLEFVNFGLYFVQDEDHFTNPLLQVGSGSNEKSTGFGGQKIDGSDRIRSSSLVLVRLTRLVNPIHYSRSSIRFTSSNFYQFDKCTNLDLLPRLPVG